MQTVAYEAFLKKTEKVPPMTYVFFCTTEGGKMPKALRSRCKVIPIQPMTPKAIYNNLLYVANKAGINLTEEDAQKIAMDSDNSARVSLQILENYSLNGGNAEKAISLQKGTSIKLEADTYKLCRAVISKTAKWDEIAQFCKVYSGSEEAVRIAILNYLNICMLNSRSMNDLKHFYLKQQESDEKLLRYYLYIHPTHYQLKYFHLKTKILSHSVPAFSTG